MFLDKFLEVCPGWSPYDKFDSLIDSSPKTTIEIPVNFFGAAESTDVYIATYIIKNLLDVQSARYKLKGCGQKIEKKQ
jgi:hypothetical protein